jgi:aconitase B
MNLEKVLERIHEIEDSIAKGMAQLHTLHGHKAEMQHWLQKLQEPVTEVNENPENPAS